MRRWATTLALAVVLVGLPSAGATARHHHYTGVRCAPRHRRELHRIFTARYSICAFRWGSNEVRVIAAPLVAGTLFKPFGLAGESHQPTHLLASSDAVAGSNGDYVWGPRRTDHLWVRDGVTIWRGYHRSPTFIETRHGAFIGRWPDVRSYVPGALDAFGGFPQVVTHGRNTGRWSPPHSITNAVVNHDPSLYMPNPRTAVGVNAGCEDGSPSSTCVAYLVTVDGRQGRWSSGVRFPALGQLLIAIGARDAVNLDGGGSTVFWVRHPWDCQTRTPRGCIIDRPVYTQRTVVQAIGLVP